MTDTSPLWFDPALCLIGGTWQPAASGGTLPLVNPSDGSEICQIARGGAADIGERGMQERVGGMWQHVGLLPAIWRRLWRPALCNEAGPIVSATIHCIAFNEDGIEVRMSAEAWLDHSDGLAAAGVCTGNRTDTGYQLLCASLGRCIPLPPAQPCPRAPIAAFSPKRSPGSRRSLQGAATRVIVDISERKGEGAGERGAGAWQKKRR